MLRKMLKAKLHRIKVTEANLKYMGSITIDCEIMERAGIEEYEQVQVVNINNGVRFETYVIPGKHGSGVICLNGAAARMVQIEDKIIVMSYVLLNEKELKKWKPKLLFFDDNNNIVDKHEVDNI